MSAELPTRALSLTQPWATLVAIGAKQIETRSWQSHWRGRIAIHAAKKYPLDAKLWAEEEPVVYRALLRAGYEPYNLPRGEVVGVCDLTHVLPTTDPKVRAFLSEHEGEELLGDYSEGRYAFRLKNVQLLRTPIPAKGNLSLWMLEPATLAEINAQLPEND